MRIEVESTYFPRLTEWHLRRIVTWFIPHDLEGLESIRVIDECPDDTAAAEVAPYLTGFLSNGHYSRRMDNRPAEVVLYARDVYLGIPKFLLLSPMTTLRIARTLAHEVGHHVIATRGYIYKPWEKYKPWTGTRDPYEEKMANAYASDVIERMLRLWHYKLGKFLARMVSTFFFKAGIQDYSDRKYQSAALLQFRAYTLDPENDDAGQCYRHAIEKLKTQSPSPLSESEREWLLQKYNPTPLGTSGRLHLTKESTAR